jgi:hypothetical protein
MKCDYCKKDIAAGTVVVVNGNEAHEECAIKAGDIDKGSVDND